MNEKSKVPEICTVPLYPYDMVVYGLGRTIADSLCEIYGIKVVVSEHNLAPDGDESLLTDMVDMDRIQEQMTEYSSFMELIKQAAIEHEITHC